jgi:hypothetical protein
MLDAFADGEAESATMRGNGTEYETNDGLKR